MPLYDYRCKKCGHIFEVKQKMTDEPIKICPKCKGTVERLVSAAGIIFKGSGFHITDNRPGEKKEVPKDTKPETKSVETKSAETKSTETKKTETKSEAKP